jgi:hypothetical protein
MSDSNGAAAHRQQLFQMSASYRRSRVLTTAARLGIADALADGERGVDDLAAACHARADPLGRLLRALATIGVVSESKPDHFVLTELGTALRKSASEGA